MTLIYYDQSTNYVVIDIRHNGVKSKGYFKTWRKAFKWLEDYDPEARKYQYSRR